MVRMRTALALTALLTLTVGLSPGFASASTTTRPVPGATRIAGGWAVPVSTKGPAWFDAAFAQRVMNAGTNGVRVPKGATMPTAVGLAYPGIRPGQWLVTV